MIVVFGNVGRGLLQTSVHPTARFFEQALLHAGLRETWAILRQSFTG